MVLYCSVCVCKDASVVSNCLWPTGLQPTSLLCPWDSPGKNAGVGHHALLQGIFPTQGSSVWFLGLLHWEVGSLSHFPQHCSCLKWGGNLIPMFLSWLELEAVAMKFLLCCRSLGMLQVPRGGRARRTLRESSLYCLSSKIPITEELKSNN